MAIFFAFLANDGAAVSGIKEAKLVTVVRIKFTAAVIRADKVASLICATVSKAGKFVLMVAIASSIFCNPSVLGLALYCL